MSEDDVDNSSGQVGLMLGLKCQRLQTSKVKKFYSDTFPEVGVYKSPALDKMIFVGATEAQLSEAMLTTCHMSQSLDLQLKNFLDAEAAIVLKDNPCTYCFDRMGCVGCKKMGNPASY